MTNILRWPRSFREWREPEPRVQSVDLSKLHRFYGHDARCRACGQPAEHEWHVSPDHVLSLADVNEGPYLSGSLASLAAAVCVIEPGARIWEDNKRFAVFVECDPAYWQAVKRSMWWAKPICAALVFVWFGPVTYEVEETEQWLADAIR